MSDLSYRNNGLFTSFYPNNIHGEAAWKVIAEQNEGTGKVLTIHAKSTIQQLRSAGYTVSAQKIVEMTNDELLELLA